MTTMNSANRAIKKSSSIETASERRRHSLVLQAWEAINSERELDGVLAAVAKVLVPVVPFFGVAIIAPEARQGAPWAMYVVGAPEREGENIDDVQEQLTATFCAREPTPPKKRIPYEGSELDEIQRASEPYICNDLLEKDAWLP